MLPGDGEGKATICKNSVSQMMNTPHQSVMAPTAGRA
jgi:hypothetical protein